MGLKQKLDGNFPKNKEIVGKMETLGMTGRVWIGQEQQNVTEKSGWHEGKKKSDSSE